MTAPLLRALQAVRYRMAAACARSGRDPSTVRLVAVTKTVPAAIVREALASGHDLFGENRVQEALAKASALPPDLRWHLLGPLQSNKARAATGPLCHLPASTSGPLRCPGAVAISLAISILSG